MDLSQNIPYLEWGKDDEEGELMRGYLMLLATGRSHKNIVRALQEAGTLDEDQDIPRQRVTWWGKNYPTFQYAYEQTLRDGLWYHRHIGRKILIAEDDAKSHNYLKKGSKGISAKKYENWLQAEGELDQQDKRGKALFEILVQQMAGAMPLPALTPPPTPTKLKLPPVIDVTPIDIKDDDDAS